MSLTKEHKSKILHQNSDELEDETLKDNTTPPVQYNITSYGADYDIDGLVRRLQRGDIIIPDFQRNYVWNQAEASRLIESLLLGLPVPGIFLAKEAQTNKLLVLDGQQRLMTVKFFYDGYFNPNSNQSLSKEFKLINVQTQFAGLTYKDLEDKDRIKIDNSIIHATVVKQDFPTDDNTSIYHIVERLNNGGRRLTPQEIRVTIYHGKFIDLIRELNDDKDWRDIFGKYNPRLKDQEFILRFLALFFNSNEYQRPMKEFLNKFLNKHKDCEESFLEECRALFKNSITFIRNALGERAFRPERSLNAAVFDSVMYGLAQRLQSSEPEKNNFKTAYESLLKDEEYSHLVSSSISDKLALKRRLEMATEKFSIL